MAIATALAAEGAKVVVNGRTEARVAAALDKFRQQVTEADVLVSNLGIFEVKPFAEIPDADWIRLFEVNVLSGVRLTRKYLPGMLKKNWGRVIFISSESGLAASHLSPSASRERPQCPRQ